MNREERERRLETFESNWGRDFGWYVQKDGRTWAALTNPVFTDMFWFRYSLEPLVEAPEENDLLFSEKFWLFVRSREPAMDLWRERPGSLWTAVWTA